MKELKKVLALMLALACCFSLTSVAFATEVTEPQVQEVSAEDEAVQPRAVLGYAYCATNGAYGGSFQVTASSAFLSAHQYTIKLANFNNGSTTVLIQIRNSNGESVDQRLFAANGEKGNIYAPKLKSGDTYTVTYSVMSDNGPANGTIEIWIY